MANERYILEKTVENIQADLDEAKAELEEFDKPKLKHGDYGHYKSTGLNWWVWSRNKISELYGVRGGGGFLPSSKGRLDMIKDGNHVDERNSEDLKEFEIEATGASGEGFITAITGKDNWIKIGVTMRKKRHTWTFDLDQTKEIHQKLGRLIAYVERKQCERR